MKAYARFVLIFVPIKRRNSPGGGLRILKDGTPVSRAELCLGLALILLALLGTWFVLQSRADALELERNPVSVEGNVLALWITTGKGAACHVRYEYSADTDNGLVVLKPETTLPEKDYRRLEVGGPIAITYCRTKPDYHLIEGKSPPSFAYRRFVPFYLGIFALVAAIGCVNLWAWWTARPWPEADES